MSQSYTIAEFCAQHKISRSMFYKLRRDGIGPRIMKVGNRTLISDDAAREWQKAMEIDTGSYANQRSNHTNNIFEPTD